MMLSFICSCRIKNCPTLYTHWVLPLVIKKAHVMMLLSCFFWRHDVSFSPSVRKLADKRVKSVRPTTSALVLGLPRAGHRACIAAKTLLGHRTPIRLGVGRLGSVRGRVKTGNPQVRPGTLLNQCRLHEKEKPTVVAPSPGHWHTGTAKIPTPRVTVASRSLCSRCRGRRGSGSPAQ
jgi:hypothetical protein